MKKCYAHGEMNIFESDAAIPKDAEIIKPEAGKYVIAKSSVTGNDHCVEAKKSVELRQKDQVFYLSAKEPVEVFCLLKDRHDSITLQAGNYEIEAAKEFDYYEMVKRQVAD